jgi:cellulose synthase/poly-beta-1,6-N-acetylglucosamine synthase-like glycosyltransferase
LALALIITYAACLLFIFFYSLVQLSLAINYVKNQHKDVPLPQVKDEDLPYVTVQLPVYNELYVVERLIEAVCKFDYPKDKLEIQVLDDSTDESFEVAAKKVAEMQALGHDIKHVKRPVRKGFKAGALAYGLDICKGDFTAIFDADFVPAPDFLRKTMPHFTVSDNIGVVQTRWEHLNEDYSIITRLQAFGLDAHFTVEQKGRNSSGHFINFNGTAGIWRKKTIVDSGGWESDTITEDLDLSYRAQLKGWDFVYLQEIGSPSELPAEMNALKAQQFRWTKGAAECTKKNLWKVLKQRGLGFSRKVHATFHLMNSFLFLCILGTSLLSVPMLIIKNTHKEYAMAFNVASFFLLSFLILAFFYWLSRPKVEGKSKLLYFLRDFPMFLSVSMGLSLHNSIAVIEGYIGKKSAFVRTPKFAISGLKGTFSDKKYRASKISPLTIGEGMLMLYFLFGLIWGTMVLHDWGMVPFHTMLVLGYGFIFFYSIQHAKD